MNTNPSRAVTETSCRGGTRLSRKQTGEWVLAIPDHDRKVDFGMLTAFKYQIDGADQEFNAVTTAWPGTTLGDIGVAVHLKSRVISIW